MAAGTEVGSGWDRPHGSQRGASPEQVAFPGHRLRAFWAGDVQFSHLPAVLAEAEHPS